MNKYDLWTFKHEPQTFDEIILSDNIKEKLRKTFIEVPNLMLVGPAGVGKGTFTKVFLKETGLDYLWINASDETGIDNIRNKVKSFATSLGITPLKVVVFNEADGLSVSGQSLLLELMERVQNITRFILMCNDAYKIIPELQSRCQVVEITSPPIKEIAKFVMSILKKENIKVEHVESVADTIKTLYPDIRQIINVLQLNSVNNKITSIQISDNDALYSKILDCSKKQDLDGVRKLLRSNPINYVDLYNYFYSNLAQINSPGDAIIEISEALYRNGFIAIKEINFIAMVLKLIKIRCL
jgi:DNA polymerase III delta prime subunit